MTGHRYMLDTNIISGMIRAPHGEAATRFAATGRHEVCISAIVASEFRYGAEKRGTARLYALVEGLLQRFEIVPYDDSASKAYARIRHDLTARGALIGPVDLFIAAHALSLNLTLVTANIQEFARVEGLAVENWVEARP